MTPIWTILSMYGGALAVLALPQRWSRAAKYLALLASLLSVAAAGLCCYEKLYLPKAPEWDLFIAWIPQFGINLHFAANGMTLALLLLTGIVATACVLFSWNVELRSRAFFANIMVIVGGVCGVFLSRNLFVLFLFYEIVILPKYLLISIWGHGDREYGAMKLTLYSIASSALVFGCLAAAFAKAGGNSFELDVLMAANFPKSMQMWAFPIMFVGFGVLAGMWPFHTWAPTGHVAAPTAASMLLAGVVMKLGAFGAMTIAIPLFPLGFAGCRLVFAIAAAVGIIYAGFVAMAQRDLKYVIGYSSVSHMGVIILGLATGTMWGFRGAVLQIISHGIIAGLLFGIVGRVIYERTHTRNLSELADFDLRRTLRGCALFFTLAAAASIGLPGFSGFVAEIWVIVGLWQSYPLLLIPLLAGIVITGIFTVRALKLTVFSPPSDFAEPKPLPPITFAEIVALVLLIGVSIAIGIYPEPWNVLITDGLNSSLFKNIFITT